MFTPTTITPSHFILDEDDTIVDWANSPREAQAVLDAINAKTHRPHTLVHKDDLSIDLRHTVEHLQWAAR